MKSGGVLGHETMGEVVAVGRECTTLKPGEVATGLGTDRPHVLRQAIHNTRNIHESAATLASAGTVEADLSGPPNHPARLPLTSPLRKG